MADNDGDAHMRSSSPDVDSEEVMFPTSTSANNTYNLATPAGLAKPPTSELSPPENQHNSFFGGGGTSATGAVNTNEGMDLNSSHLLTTGAGPEGRAGGKGKQRVKGEDENEPGYAWSNRRAVEEHARALDALVDPKWNLHEFGDPFDESDMIVRE
ncbi:MAG: hypothetical protein M1837_005609 [Sclerophora amabilis]|nr:MAG: hypothetical protein M1837_005609 [Sclerophora amabilis]